MTSLKMFLFTLILTITTASTRDVCTLGAMTAGGIGDRSAELDRKYFKFNDQTAYDDYASAGSQYWHNGLGRTTYVSQTSSWPEGCMNACCANPACQSFMFYKSECILYSVATSAGMDDILGHDSRQGPWGISTGGPGYSIGFWEMSRKPRSACPALKCTIHCDTGYVTDANGCETCECQPQVYVQSTGICAPHHAPGTGLPVDLPLDLDQCKSMCDNHPSCTSFHYAHLSGPHHQWSHRCILKSTSRGCTAQEQQDAEQYYRDLGLGCCLDKSCPNNQVVGGAVGYNYQHGWICYDTYMKAQFLPTRRQLTGRLLSESNSV